MRIVISTENGNVAQHFGRCPEFTLVDIENGIVIKKEIVPNPGHAPGVLPKFFSQLGCKTIIAGGMGNRAQDLFRTYNMDWIIGVQGDIDSIIDEYIEGKLTAGDSMCEHGESKGPGTRKWD